MITGKTSLISIFSDLKRRGLSDGMFRTLIESLWRDTHDDNVIENIHQTAHGFIIGQPVKVDSVSGLWVSAQADEAAHARTIGLVCRVVDVNTFWVRRAGILPGDYTPGADYYLSSTTAGEIFIQTNPEVWADTDVREYIGTGDADGNLVIRIDWNTTIDKATNLEIINATDLTVLNKYLAPDHLHLLEAYCVGGQADGSDHVAELIGTDPAIPGVRVFADQQPKYLL